MPEAGQRPDQTRQDKARQENTNTKTSDVDPRGSGTSLSLHVFFLQLKDFGLGFKYIKKDQRKKKKKKRTTEKKKNLLLSHVPVSPKLSAIRKASE